jgi:hypothetical protein
MKSGFSCRWRRLRDAHTLVVQARTNIDVIVYVANPRVTVSVPLANTVCPICGGIIRNDQFKILIILNQDGLNGLPNESFAVVDWHADTD